MYNCFVVGNVIDLLKLWGVPCVWQASRNFREYVFWCLFKMETLSNSYRGVPSILLVDSEG